MTVGKFSKVFALLKQINSTGMGLTYQQAVKDLTDNRTDSLSSLDAWEVQELERMLLKMVPSDKSKVAPDADKADRMRKSIISIFKSIGGTVDDAKKWAEKYGVNGKKKAFNEYTPGELFLLIRNAETMKKDHIKALNK